MLAAMQSGVLDLASQMLGRDAAKLQNNSKYQVGSTPGVDVYLGISTQIKPLDDVRVRQAIAYALDRKRIASQVYQGFADPSCVLWNSKTAGVTDEMVHHYTYDVDKAKSLLQEAGAVGAQIEFAPSPQDPAFAAIGEIVQYNLEQIGIKIKRVSVTSAEWPKLNQAHNLPAMWVGQVELTGSGPVTTLLSSNPLTPDSNTSHFSPPDYQSKVAALLAAPSDDVRSQDVAALTNYMLEQAFHDTVVQERSPLVSVSGLTGVGTDATYSLVLTGASLAS
jgi:peptide/nickel transport system substrate-binding protein